MQNADVGTSCIALCYSMPGKFQALRLCALSALELANAGRSVSQWLVVLRFCHIQGRRWSEQ
jgi:hypothetical protein